MSPDAMGVILTAVAGLLTALGGVWVARSKGRSETQTLQMDRLGKLEAKVDALEKKVDSERALRFREERRAQELTLNFLVISNFIETYEEWVRGGLLPPPPKAPSLQKIEDLLAEE